MSTLSLVRLAPLAALVAAGCVVQTVEPNLVGQDVHLTVMHTADLHSRFFPYYFAPGQIDAGLGLIKKPGQTTAVVGGIARVGMILKCVRGFYTGPECRGITQPDDHGVAVAGPPAARSIHLDSGDIFEGAPVFNQFNGEVEMRAMSNVGLSAMALGNHEFDKGSVNLEEQAQRFGGFPILAANYQFADPNDYTQPKLADLIHPYTILNVGGLKVGVIGLGNLSSIQGIIEGGNSLGVRPLDATSVIVDLVRVVRPQVDVLVLVSHMGLDEDEGVAAGDAAMRDQNVALAIDGVDVIFGGHLHIVLNPPKDLPHFASDTGELTGHTVLCHSGAFAKYVGRLDLVVHMPTTLEAAAGQRASVKSYTYTLVPIDDSLPSDPQLSNMLEPYQLKMNAFLNLNQDYAIVACPAAGAAACPKVLRNDPDGGDSQLGNLVATAMRLRQRVEADFGLTNSLGIRADFESGPLNLEQLYNVFPFDNTITTMFLSGNEVQQMLDFVAARSAERGCRTQAQVSGIYFDLVCASNDKECNDRLGYPAACAKNIHLGDGCRMPDGTFNGTKCKPLDLFGVYRVAVNDYIAQGGSGFAVLKRNTTKFNTGISLRDALADYIRTLTHRCDPKDFTNIVGATCKDAQGETYDCSSTCATSFLSCRSAGMQPQWSGTTSCSAPAQRAGACADGSPAVLCRDANNHLVDCTMMCGDSSTRCQAAGLYPAGYDYTDTACLDDSQQPHDGRIQTYAGGAGSAMGPQ
jgi:5'-nucleotidase